MGPRYWRRREHPALFLALWSRAGYEYRCVLCGRRGVWMTEQG